LLTRAPPGCVRGLLRARLPQRQLHAVRCAATSYFERDKTVLDPKDLGFRRDLHQVYNVPDPSMTVPLGTGSYGVVNKVTKKSTGEEFAMKTIPKQPPNERESKSPQSYLEKLVSEVRVMQHIGPSLNVVYLYEVFEDESHIHLVMEYCRGGELWARIRTGKYSEAYAAQIMRSILQVLAQCHGKNVIYRDVKPDNFLFLTSDDKSPLKATDFGLATYFTEGEVITRRCGTPSYLAPEVVMRNYGPEADLWSAGVTLFQLLSGRLPFRDAHRRATVKDVLRAVVEDEITLDDEFWTTKISSSARDLVARLLDRNPKTRITASEALNHPWLLETDGDASTTPLDGSIVQRLQRYSTFPSLKRQVLRFIAPSLLQEDHSLDMVVQAKDLYQIFKQFDYHKHGHLENEDLLKGLQESGYNVTAEEVKQLISAVDVDHNGMINYEEFLTTMIDWSLVEQHDSNHFHELVDELFDSLDRNHSGGIEREEMKDLMCREGMSDDECEIMIEQAMDQADAKGDGVIDKEEFFKFVHTEVTDNLSQYADRVEHESKPRNASEINKTPINNTKLGETK